MNIENEKLFEKLWEYQQGSLMLKEGNSSLEWKKAIARFFRDCRGKEIAKLKQQLSKAQADNELLLKCVEFYGNQDSWMDNDLFGFPPSIVGDSLDGKDCDLIFEGEILSKHTTIGGKIARQTLKQIKEKKE